MSMSRLGSHLYFGLIMFLVILAFCILGFLAIRPAPCVCDHMPCINGRICPFETVCCAQGCCAVPSGSPLLNEIPTWYAQWPVLFLIGTLCGVVLCCIWCVFFKRSRPNGRHLHWSCHCCARRPTSEHDSAGSVYPPPRYSRCGSIHQAPPPYSEVTSKPDLYPLVITCGEGEGKSASGAGTLMVQFYRNYVIRAPGSLSATSTAESLNSSLMSNSANEANSVVPPPYSCANNYEDCVGLGYGRALLRSLSSLTDRERPPPRSRTAPDSAPAASAPPRREPTAAFRENLITSPVQPLDPAFDLELDLLDCELCCEGGCKPQLGPSPPGRSPPSDDSLFEREPYSLRHLFSCPSPERTSACPSPPQPTSPTDSTLLRQSEERRHRRLDNVKKALKTRKSSLYMPLSVAYPVRSSRAPPGARASSRSAPATPCGALVPNLLTFTQRVSASRHSSRSSRFDEESDPLLLEIEHSRTEHKF